jgi:uncharacterized Zn-binding protein involved in type VI secretion
MGNIYDLKHRPPKHSTEKKSDSIVYQTKGHRLEFIDEEGKESIIISSAKGKMRLTLTKGQGIELINELGDTRIKCRKLRIEGKEGVRIEGKKVRIEAGDKAVIEGRKGIKLESGKEAVLKGNNIRLEGSRGVTAEGKQMAAEGYKVAGFDIHQMVVPSGSGTAVVPLPHPFLGKLKEKLSNNVKIKGHNAAVKGSVAKHDDMMHNQLPGTIQFQNMPKKEGEVTGGTARKVKINGKEAAVVGSKVTTCNDIGARDNSVILALGGSMPMPVIINPKNTEEYERERAKGKKKEPVFTEVKWGKGKVKEGEAVEISAVVKDIADGNMVTFQVWKEGQEPETHIAVARITAEIEGGEAKGKWKYPSANGEELPPDEDPRYYVTAHSAWCPYKKSGNLTVELMRPDLSNLKWLDKEGKETGKRLVGETLKLEASCNGDMEEGAGVTFRVYKEGANPKRDEPEYEAGANNKGGKAEAEWYYEYRHDVENPLKEKPKFFFTVNAQRCREAKSGNVEISAKIDIIILDGAGKTFGDRSFKLTMVDKTQNLQTKKDGSYQQNDCVPGYMKIEGITVDESENENGAEEYGGDEPRTQLVMAEGKSKAIVLPNWEKVILQIVSPLGKLTT